MTKQETRELQMTGIMTDMAGKFEDGTITVSKKATQPHSLKGNRLVAYTEYEKGLGTVVIRTDALLWYPLVGQFAGFIKQHKRI